MPTWADDIPSQLKGHGKRINSKSNMMAITKDSNHSADLKSSNSYLKRLGIYLNASKTEHRNKIDEQFVNSKSIESIHKTNGLISDNNSSCSENSSLNSRSTSTKLCNNNYSNKPNCEPMVCDSLQLRRDSHVDNNREGTKESGYMLPRIMIKNSSTNSLLTDSNLCTNPIKSMQSTNALTCNKTTLNSSCKNVDKHLINTNQIHPTFDNTDVCRERVSSIHYSTEKSGSSGYYSSNIYSINSMDEHIYSEPVSDIMLHSTVQKLPLKIVNNKPYQDKLFEATKIPTTCDNNAVEVNTNTSSNGSTYDIDIDHNICTINKKHSQQSLVYNRSTVDLNSSIFPRDGTDRFDKRRSFQLPTIMEGGCDNNILPLKPNIDHIWPANELVDDSLTDLDLDSFLLANEIDTVKQTDQLKSPDHLIYHNPNARSIENNYRCTKYINSCPDDPYIVEGIIDSEQPSIDKSIAFYLEKCDNQMHFQYTKDILDEIRQKLDQIIISNTKKQEVPFVLGGISSLAESESGCQSNSIERKIRLLKNDFDEYVKLINESNELEIKQLCSGLSKDHKLLAIQNAMENKFRTRDSDVNKADKPSLENNSETKTNYCDPESTIFNFDTVFVRDGYHLGYKSCNQFRSRPSMMDSNFNFQQNNNVYAICSSCENLRQHTNSLNSSDDFDKSRTDECSSYSMESGHNGALHQQNVNLATTVHRIPHTEEEYRKHVLLNDEKNMMLEWHRNKPSIWEMYYGSNRLNHVILKKVKGMEGHSVMSYPSSRPESDFTLDLPRAEQLRIKMKHEKQFRHRCRVVTSIFSLIFFLLTVMVVSLILTRGKRMFGSMI